MKKKLLVMMLALAMVLVFAACGGGSGSEAEPAAKVEPNAGVGGIVFAVPDSWTQTNNSPGSYTEFKLPDSDFSLVASAFGDKELEEQNQWSDEEPVASVQEYFDKYYTVDEKKFKEQGVEHSVVKVCDTDADYNKYTGGKDGYFELGTNWMADNTIYSVFMFNQEAFDENGKIRDDAAPLTDDAIKAYEAVIASVQKGDGTAFQTEALAAAATSIGSIAFEAPEGYTVSDCNDTFVNFKKDGSTVELQVMKTGEEDLGNVTMDDGSTPSSLDEYYNMYERDAEDAATIAGYDGYINKYPFEDDKYYNISAEFMAEDAIYNVYMGTDAWDENGDLKDGAESLSDEDLAVFDAFIASMKKK